MDYEEAKEAEAKAAEARAMQEQATQAQARSSYNPYANYSTHAMHTPGERTASGCSKREPSRSRAATGQGISQNRP